MAFTTADTVPPEVVHLIPACGTRNLSPVLRVCADLSEPVDPATAVYGDSVSVKIIMKKGGGTGLGSGGTAEVLVPGSLSFAEDLRSLCFLPDAPLAGNSGYRVRLTGEILDRAGLSLVPFDCEFDTVETTPPTVKEASPADGATDVGLSMTVEATFSETLDPTTVVADSLTLRDGSGMPAPGSALATPGPGRAERAFYQALTCLGRSPTIQ